MDNILRRLSNIKRIIGPNNLNITKLNNKLILLFGDFHTITDNCTQSTEQSTDISIIELFELFGQNSIVPVEIFVEGYKLIYGYQDDYKDFYNQMRSERMIFSNIGTLPNILTRYWYCFGNEDNYCNNLNMRIHNIDFRRNPKSKYDFMKLPLIKDKNAYLNLIIGLLYGNMHLVAESLNIIYGCTEYNYHDLIRESNYYYIAEQYNNIPRSDELRRAIIQLFIDKEYSFQYEDKYAGIYIRSIIAYISIIYAIARIVRTIYENNEPGIIMVYAGHRHIDKYTKLLTSIYGANFITTSDGDEYFELARRTATDQYELEELKKILPENVIFSSCTNVDRSVLDTLIRELNIILNYVSR
ncbi:Hypothetical protein HVR_LOCUS635 [uncultured virus]|nr:Hypothetical protein HVR_LOCUS635 [uncultured virus]